MKICVIGNCQIQPIRLLLESMDGELECDRTLPSVYSMTAADETRLAEVAQRADYIVAQRVGDDYPIKFARTRRLREQFGDKVVVWPNAYFIGYGPEWGTLPDEQMQNFSGPLLDYHSDLILLGFFSGWQIDRTRSVIEAPSEIDELWYANSILASLDELRTRERDTDIQLSTWIDEHFRHQRLFYVMNHPSISLLTELSRRLLVRMGRRPRAVPPAWMHADLELVQACHPENEYMRHTAGMTFGRLRLYRGVRLLKVSSPLGFAPGLPRVYTDEEVIEAYYKFYDRHAERLVTHPRVSYLMDRYRRRGIN